MMTVFTFMETKGYSYNHHFSNKRRNKMSYTPKEWQCGDTITAEAMNHIEQGIAQNSGGVLTA